MAFNLSKFIKGLLISEAGTRTPASIEIIPAGTASTTTSITSSQTVDRDLTLPDEDGTILTNTSTIDLDQLEAVAANRAIVSNGTGHMSAATTTATEIGYVNGVTSAIQTQLDNKADLDLGNILPTTSIDINGQVITNSGTPTQSSDLATKDYVDTNVSTNSANKTLSNLTSPTSVNQDLISTTVGGQKSIGTVSIPWATVIGTTTRTNTITNLSLNPSIDVTNRQLKTAANGTALDWNTSGQVSVNGAKITSLGTPTISTDAVTKAYVDAAVVGAGANLSFKAVMTGGTSVTTAARQVFQSQSWNDVGLGSYDNTTGLFTVTNAGKYMIVSNLYFTVNLSTTQFFQTQLRINDAAPGPGNQSLSARMVGNGNSIAQNHIVTNMVSVSAGDTISVYALSDVSASISAGSQFSILFLGT